MSVRPRLGRVLSAPACMGESRFQRCPQHVPGAEAGPGAAGATGWGHGPHGAPCPAAVGGHCLPVPARGDVTPAPPAPLPRPRAEARPVSQVKLLNEELGALRAAGAQAAESLRSAQAANSELEDRLQRAAWELRDLAAVKDARCGPSCVLPGGGAPRCPWGPCLERPPALVIGRLSSNTWFPSGSRSWRTNFSRCS